MQVSSLKKNKQKIGLQINEGTWKQLRRQSNAYQTDSTGLLRTTLTVQRLMTF